MSNYNFPLPELSRTLKPIAGYDAGSDPGPSQVMIPSLREGRRLPYSAENKALLAVRVGVF